MPKHLAILGSTGSIGTQALEVVRQHPDRFVVEVLTARDSVDLLIKQAIEFKPNAVVISNELHYRKLRDALDRHDIKVFAGEQSVADVVTFETVDMVLTALVGYAGLLPTLKAIQHGKHIALANKETLVVAGALVTEAAYRNKVMLLPVDSEHSAIFQCLAGERVNKPVKLILTGSGGPFRTFTDEMFESITPEMALKHPTWQMGPKITIDSASLMNKGLEVIEAHWLFSIPAKDIQVVIHPQSIVHSAVEFTDGSVKAQLGLPDMRLPIRYALSYPERLVSPDPRFDFFNYSSLTFEKPDTVKFRNLALAFNAINQGGNMPCILNAANEVAVKSFLQGKIGFFAMSDLIEDCMQRVSFMAKPDLDQIIETDKATRQLAESLLSKN
ncbi:MAG: 1-deoxy-D-xylulose-5-phosphate reductoisomerase [Sphingobacteriia bacterium]|nr:1-deoxy-D-xylulose-5-phosphate reductoisomerase [Sphingobacteriia bacterium]